MQITLYLSNTLSTTDKEPVEAIQMKQNPVYDVTTAGPPQPSTAHTDAIQLQPNVLYGVNTEPGRGDQTTYYVRTGIQMKQNPVYDVTTATADTDAIQLQPNVLYGVSTEPDRRDQTTYYENEGLGPQTNKPNEYDYVQL